MNKELRRVSIVVLLMFVALFVSTSIIQVMQADALKADGRNTRTLFESYSAERGPILVDGQAVAESQPVDDEYMFQRSYPGGELYAPITGYFTLNQGNAGLEGELNDYLSGSANEQFFDQLNAIITGQDPKGAAVELTIDPVIQQAAWDALGDQQGSVVAIDPATGGILAMVSKPSFDPNLFAVRDTEQVISTYNQLLEDPNDPLINRATNKFYFPGSVFKVLMAAAALEHGIRPEDEVPNPARLTLPDSTNEIGNSEGGSCGGGETASLATALRLSCNIPFAQFGQQLGYEAINETAEAFGFGQEFGIPTPVTASEFPEPDSEAFLMLQSFGQGEDRVTPLQIAMISAAVANDGVLMQPTLVEEIVSPDLEVLQPFEPQELSEPMSPENADTLTQMMVEGVANGAASNATIAGVDVAGKTGTAENGGDDPYTLWFTGFAPADDPQVAIAVVVENGGGLGQSAFGNQVAAPIARQVLEAVLNR